MDGNKLRDVLRKARAFIDCSPLKKIEDDFGCIDRDEICAEINAALAEPVKNCEVGTAGEQEKRFHDFCRARHLPRTEDSRYCAYKCPLEGDTCCELQWAQMPYKEGGAK